MCDYPPLFIHNSCRCHFLLLALTFDLSFTSCRINGLFHLGGRGPKPHPSVLSAIGFLCTRGDPNSVLMLNLFISKGHFCFSEYALFDSFVFFLDLFPNPLLPRSHRFSPPIILSPYPMSPSHALCFSYHMRLFDRRAVCLSVKG